MASVPPAWDWTDLQGAKIRPQNGKDEKLATGNIAPIWGNFKQLIDRWKIFATVCRLDQEIKVTFVIGLVLVLIAFVLLGVEVILAAYKY